MTTHYHRCGHEDCKASGVAVDPDLQAKIVAAKAAREMGRQLRADKPVSFRRGVGRGRSR